MNFGNEMIASEMTNKDLRKITINYCIVEFRVIVLFRERRRQTMQKPDLSTNEIGIKMIISIAYAYFVIGNGALGHFHICN